MSRAARTVSPPTWRAGDVSVASMSASPHLTVAIATRDRGKSMVQTLQTEATASYKQFDAVVIDQIRDGSTELSVRHLIDGDRCFTYVRSQTTGLSVACNLALNGDWSLH